MRKANDVREMPVIAQRASLIHPVDVPHAACLGRYNNVAATQRQHVDQTSGMPSVAVVVNLNTQRREQLPLLHRATRLDGSGPPTPHNGDQK